MNYSNFWNLWKRSLKCKSLQSKMALLFYRNQGRWDTQVLKDGRLNTAYTRYNPDMTEIQKIYSMIAFLWISMEYTASISNFDELVFWQQCLMGIYTCAGLSSITFFMDNVHGIGKYCEIMRFITFLIAVPFFAINDFDESSVFHFIYSRNLMAIILKLFWTN